MLYSEVIIAPKLSFSNLAPFLRFTRMQKKRPKVRNSCYFFIHHIYKACILSIKSSKAILYNDKANIFQKLSLSHFLGHPASFPGLAKKIKIDPKLETHITSSYKNFIRHVYYQSRAKMQYYKKIK